MLESPDAAEEIARLAQSGGLHVVTAESITAGGIATALATAPNASDWFRGGVVVYQTELKRRLLGVTAEQIVSHECATQMAAGVLTLAEADLAVAVTGVGGPGPEEGRPPGTVIICVGGASGFTVFEHHLDGAPAEVVRLAIQHSLDHLRRAALG